MSTFNRLRASFILLLLSGSIAFVPQARGQSQIPQLLNYQGVLSDALRTAVPDAAYKLTFRIYSAETGGAALWEETNTVSTIDGIFETLLGLSAPLTLPFDQPYWLAIELEGEAEMTPRIPFVSTPYAMNASNAVIAETAMALHPAALDVVHTLNGLEGRLTVVGAGLATVTEAGTTITIAVPNQLPTNPTDGQVIRWNGAAGAWEAVTPGVLTTPRLKGDGTAANPLGIADMGAVDGQPLVWNSGVGAWQPGEAGVTVKSPLNGTGSSTNPLSLKDGAALGQVLYWNATEWIPNSTLPPTEGDVLRWDNVAATWVAGEESVEGDEEISGNGTVADPLRLAQQGAAEGEVLRWDNSAQAWRPAPSLSLVTPPLSGTGSPGDPLRLINGETIGQMIYWEGRQWVRTAQMMPQEGWVMRWNNTTGVWEPGVVAVTDAAPLSRGALWYGNGTNVATELPVGTPNQVLTVNPTATGPVWSSQLNVDSVNGQSLTIAGEAVLNGSLTVNGTAVNLPAGSIDNAELANASINVAYGAGLSGDASVALGDTLHLQNTGVLSLTGTANQVNVDQATGDVTLSLPQDIHTDAVPTFDGLILDNMMTGSSSTDLIVSNGGSLESRTFSSLHPGGVLPVGTTDATLRHDGTAWVESSNLRVDASGNVISEGDLTVNGTAVNLPAGSIDNVELANASINVAYGAGLSGDASVALGDTLHLQNTGVLSLTGTANQVNVDQATGDVTLSLPQDIHTDAVPTFDGMILDNLSGGSGATNLLVISNDSVQMRTVASLASEFEDNFWTTTGNAGTTAGTQFIGTTDAQPFEIHVDDGNSTGSDGRGRVMRFEPNGSSPSIVAGYQGNSSGGHDGVTIAGGGRSGEVNVVDAQFATIAGGLDNQIGTNAISSTIGGGYTNIIRNSANRATIGGGRGNTIAEDGDDATIAGGNGNTISPTAQSSTIGGGYTNTIDTAVHRATIGGGQNNKISQGGDDGTISGGLGNTINVGSVHSTIAGGQNNQVNGFASTVSGGDNNRAVWLAAIGGGQNNWAHFSLSAIAGGINNESLFGAAIGGGGFNKAGYYAAIPGGRGLEVGSGSFGFLGDNGSTPSNASTIGDRPMTITESNVALFGNVDLMLANNNGAASQLRFYEANSTTGNLPNTVNYSSFQAQDQTTNVNYILPAATGAAGDVLSVASIAGTQVTLGWASNTSINVSDSAWSLTGNAGTTPGTNFLGTTDAQSMHIYVNNGTDNALILNTNGSIQTTTDGNARGADAVDLQRSRSATSQVAGGSFSGVLGGERNEIASSSPRSAIVNGIDNTIGANAQESFIGGGINNTILVQRSAILGGRNNYIGTGAFSAMVGGFQDTVYSDAWQATLSGGGHSAIGSGAIRATISGGGENKISANSVGSVIGGGETNTVTSGAAYATIAGGRSNNVASSYSVAGGGLNNSVSGSYGVIAGGNNNTVSSNFSMIGGGQNNSISSSAASSAIIAGNTNSIGNNSFRSFIGGGDNVNIEAGARQAAILSGLENRISLNAYHTFIGSGWRQTIDTNANDAAIVGGQRNTVGNNADRSFIGAGDSHTIGAGASNSSIVAGNANSIASGSSNSAISAGNNITIDASSSNSFIGSGNNLSISTSSTGSFIGAGQNNSIGSSAPFSGIGGGSNVNIGSGAFRSFIGSGLGLTIEASAQESSIVAGVDSRIANNADRTFIGTGWRHLIDTNANDAAIVGGQRNTIGNNSDRSFIGAGDNLLIGAGSSNAFIGAGQNNTIENSAGNTVIGGGSNNKIRLNSTGSTIGGGANNIIDTGANRSVIAGGLDHLIGNNADDAAIGGGRFNDVYAGSSVVSGGTNNIINAGATQSTIAGGNGNVIEINANQATISGGQQNYIGNNADQSTIGGGRRDTILVSNATISGGSDHMISTGAGHGVIGGGTANSIGANSWQTTIAGGGANAIGANSWQATIAGGGSGQIGDNSAGSTIGGGALNTITGRLSVIPGGRELTLNGNSSFGFLGNESGNFDMTITANEVAVFGNTDLWLANNNNGASQIRFYEANNTTGTFPNGTNYSSFQARTQAADINYLLPDTAGIVGDVLSVASVAGSLVTLDWTAGGSASTINVSDSAWALTGNAGTTPGTNFVGTTDAQALHLYVNSGSNNALILNTNGSLQHDNGGNARGNSAIDLQRSRTNATEVASGTGAVIVGGSDNTVASNNAGVVTGLRNSISTANLSFIGGGSDNTITAGNGVIGGGASNSISDNYGTIGGGLGNAISGSANATIGGGVRNTIDQNIRSTIGGGYEHYIAINAGASVIAGGEQDSIYDGSWQVTIAGGGRNVVGASSWLATIGGGRFNTIGDTSSGSVIAGGTENTLIGGNSAIAGGRELTLQGKGSFGFLSNESGSFPMSVTSDEVALFGNTDLWLANNNNGASQLRFYEANNTTGTFPNGTNYTSFKAGTQTADINYTLPAATPNAAANGTDLGTGYMETDNVGAMSWRQSVVVTATNLNFGNVASQTSSDVTVTVTGAAVGDIVNIGVDNAAVAGNSCYTAWVSAANTVTIRFNNYSLAAIAPATTNTFKVQVTK
ncbi:MAG: beta strand repeat-containing protein [Candidatus Kapaibacterium sp.]